MIYKGKVHKIINSGILAAISGYKLLAYIPKHHIKSYDFKRIDDQIELDQEIFIKVVMN